MNQAGDSALLTYLPSIRHDQVHFFQSRQLQHRVKVGWLNLSFLMLDRFFQIIEINFAFEPCFQFGIHDWRLFLGQCQQSQRLRIVYLGIIG